MDVSIVMPLYAHKPELIRKIDSALKKQKFNGKIEVIKVDKGLGLADSINFGINKSKYPIVVTLHQDCVPDNENWLSVLTLPFKDKKVVASVSKVLMPKELWEGFDFVSKILSVKEQKLITPAMDEKGCAFRKSVFNKIGLFDGKTFRTAGEDFDMYLKLKKAGKIAYPETKVIHYHSYSWKSRLKKELQLPNAFGALVRTYKTEMPKWYVGTLKAIPVVGYPLFFIGLDFKKLGLVNCLLSIPLLLYVNLLYSYGFWKGFISGKEVV
jgi:GT2 family glycosyltransferase